MAVTKGLIATADLNAQLDDLVLAFMKLKGTSASGFGAGDPATAGYGCALKLSDMITEMYNSEYVDVIDAVGELLRDCAAAMDPATLLGVAARSVVRAYGQHATDFQPDATVVSLDSLLTYLNTSGGTWAALQDSNLRDVFYHAMGAYPSVNNLYQEILQGAYTTGLDHLYTNGLGKFVASGAGAGAFTKAVVEGALITDGSGGAEIDSSKYAGGFPQTKTSGLAGSGNITWTVDVYDRATKSVMTGKTLIFNITGNGTNNAVSGGTAPANALVLHATNSGIAAGITAGTFYLEASRPAGRSLLA